MADKVGEQVTAEREVTHGNFSRNARVSQGLKDVWWRSVSSDLLSAVQKEAAEMIFMKLSRVASGHADHIDHWRDIAGYATLVVKDLETR